MFRLMSFATALIAASPATAQDMPHYDVEAHCTRMAGITNGGEFMLNACLQQEQSAYNTVKPDWSGLPAARREHCDNMARVTQGGYFMLAACLEQEERAAEQNKSFTIQR